MKIYNLLKNKILMLIFRDIWDTLNRAESVSHPWQPVTAGLSRWWWWWWQQWDASPSFQLSYPKCLWIWGYMGNKRWMPLHQIRHVTQTCLGFILLFNLSGDFTFLAGYYGSVVPCSVFFISINDDKNTKMLNSLGLTLLSSCSYLSDQNACPQACWQAVISNRHNYKDH